MTAAIIPVPAAFTSPQIIIMVALALISLACIAAMIYAIRETRGRFLPAERTQWLVIAAVITGIGITMIDNRVDPYISPTDRVLITTPPQPVIVNLADCPEAGPGMTDQLVMTIETRSDTTPLITGCNRIAERSFVIKAESGQ